jgi:hypothetical protein
VDESAEQIAAAQGRDCTRLLERGRVAAFGRQEPERAVGPVLVVVAAVDAEHALEVAATEDEDPVEAVGADSPHPAFGVGVRVWRMDGCADHLDPFGAEDVIEGVAEFAVTIVDEKRDGWSSPSSITKLRACWATQPPSGLALQAMYSIRLVASEMKNNT